MKNITTITTRDALYNFLDSMPHDEKKTAGEQIMDIQYTGAFLADAGWRSDDIDLLQYLAEEWDDGRYLTSEQARYILHDMDGYAEKDEDEDDEISDDEWIPLL